MRALSRAERTKVSREGETERATGKETGWRRAKEKHVKIKGKEQYNAEKEITPKRKGKRKGIHKSFFSSWEEITHTHREIRCFAAQLLGKETPREQRTQSDVKKEKGKEKK